MIGIYKITNKIDGKIYIGQSINVERRIREHKNRAVSNYNNSETGTALNKALKKYGIENFNFELLESCKEEDLNKRERYYISLYNSAYSKNGYNETLGGDNSSGGRSLTLEDVEKISDLLRNSKESETDIAKKFNVSLDMISKINVGTYWTREISYPIRDRAKNSITCPICGKYKDPGAKMCLDCYNKEKSKDVPSKEQLLKDFDEFGTKAGIARKYNKSDSAVRKWFKKYNLPY